MQNLCPQPEEVIANNEDLLRQILLCLPARSLLRCKCISKQWHSLISNRKFCDRHTLQNPNSMISAFFFNKSKTKSYYLSLPHNENPSGCPPTPLNFIQDPAGIQILQSCNGLLLCGSCCQVNTTRRYYVVNPTTNQFFKLPATSKSTNIWCVSLAFDPSKSLHYKVICVRNAAAYLDYPQLQVELEIYSSKTRSWRLGISTFLDAVDAFGIDFSHGVYCNGAIHWINRAGVLLHYDIDEACFRVVHSLPGYENGEHRYFGESGGHLYRVETFRPYITQFVVLEMERDYSGWSVKYHVDLHLIISAFPEMVRDYYDPSDCYSYSFVVLFVALEESEEDSTLLLHIPCKLISYNLRDKTFKKLCDLTPIGTQTKKCLQVGWNTYHYMETLACV